LTIATYHTTHCFIADCKKHPEGCLIFSVMALDFAEIPFL
jgi:hypothetical protein